MAGNFTIEENLDGSPEKTGGLPLAKPVENGELSGGSAQVG